MKNDTDNLPLPPKRGADKLPPSLPKPNGWIHETEPSAMIKEGDNTAISYSKSASPFPLMLQSSSLTAAFTPNNMTRKPLGNHNSIVKSTAASHDGTNDSINKILQKSDDNKENNKPAEKKKKKTSLPVSSPEEIQKQVLKLLGFSNFPIKCSQFSMIYMALFQQRLPTSKSAKVRDILRAIPGVNVSSTGESNDIDPDVTLSSELISTISSDQTLASAGSGTYDESGIPSSSLSNDKFLLKLTEEQLAQSDTTKFKPDSSVVYSYNKVQHQSKLLIGTVVSIYVDLSSKQLKYDIRVASGEILRIDETRLAHAPQSSVDYQSSVNDESEPAVVLNCSKNATGSWSYLILLDKGDGAIIVEDVLPDQLSYRASSDDRSLATTKCLSSDTLDGERSKKRPRTTESSADKRIEQLEKEKSVLEYEKSVLESNLKRKGVEYVGDVDGDKTDEEGDTKVGAVSKMVKVKEEKVEEAQSDEEVIHAGTKPPNGRVSRHKVDTITSEMLKKEDYLEGLIQCPDINCNKITACTDTGCNVLTCTRCGSFFCVHCKLVCSDNYSTCDCSKDNTYEIRVAEQKKRNLRSP